MGHDLLNGGLGSDNFNFSLQDSTTTSTDLIQDFEQGQDKINLSQIEEDLFFNSLEFTVENGYTVIKDQNSDFAINLHGEFVMHEDDFIF